MNKKASMQLGINAIVVLIIALAVLGLAMSFITNLFRKGETQLGGIITNVEMPVRADAGEPIKFDMRDVSVKSGSSTTELKVSVYNNNNFLETEEVKVYMDCWDPLSDEVESSLSISGPPQLIPVGSDVGYGEIIVSTGTDPGTYPCRLIASSAGSNNYDSDPKAVSGQIFITVKT